MLQYRLYCLHAGHMRGTELWQFRHIKGTELWQIRQIKGTELRQNRNKKAPAVGGYKMN